MKYALIRIIVTIPIMLLVLAIGWLVMASIHNLHEFIGARQDPALMAIALGWSTVCFILSFLIGIFVTEVLKAVWNR